jgi:hypothetical protein
MLYNLSFIKPSQSLPSSNKVQIFLFPSIMMKLIVIAQPSQMITESSKLFMGARPCDYKDIQGAQYNKYSHGKSSKSLLDSFYLFDMSRLMCT